NGANVGVTVNNYNQITWSSGNINLTSTLTNFSGGTINVDTPAVMSGAGYLVNNFGATITSYVNVPSNAPAVIMVPFGPSNTNFGTINDTSGFLSIGATSQFTNEGRIEASVNNSGSEVDFAGPFQQIPNTQSAGTLPAMECEPGDEMQFE